MLIAMWGSKFSGHIRGRNQGLHKVRGNGQDRVQLLRLWELLTVPNKGTYNKSKYGNYH